MGIDLGLLLLTAASIGFVHTLAGTEPSRCGLAIIFLGV